MSNNINSARKFESVCKILDKYNKNPARIITILQEVQKEYRYLPKKVLTFIATSLEISPAKVFGVATFYSHFALEPKGKNIIKICNGTACHVKGSGKLIDKLRKHLNLSEKKITTDDMLFTLETVSCLGACGLAPVVVINDKVYGQVTEDKALKLIKSLREEETA